MLLFCIGSSAVILQTGLPYCDWVLSEECDGVFTGYVTSTLPCKSLILRFCRADRFTLLNQVLFEWQLLKKWDSQSVQVTDQGHSEAPAVVRDSYSYCTQVCSSRNVTDNSTSTWWLAVTLSLKRHWLSSAGSHAVCSRRRIIVFDGLHADNRW